MNWPRILLALIAGALGSILVLSADESPGPMLDPEVAFVSTGGTWSQGDRSGAVRVVVVSGGFEHLTSRVFVQWIGVDRERGRWVAESTPVQDINAPGVWSVDRPEIYQKNGATIIRLPATNSYTGEEAEFVLTLEGVGDFNIER